MARLKFLVFALVALGLWAYHLTMIAPLAIASSTEQAQASVAGATGPIAVALESRRSLTQVVALKVVGGNAAWNPGPKPGAKPEAPTVDRFAAVRSAAAEAVPTELKEQLFVGLSNEVGSLSVKGTGEPASTPPEGVEFAQVIEAGSAGAVKTIDGASYLLFAVPMVISEKNEVRQAGSAIVGLPLLPDAKVLEETVKALGLRSLALVADGKPVLSAGEPAGTTEVLAGIKAGASGALGSGPVRELGPLSLPLFTADSAHAIGGRHPIGGTSLEVAASASSKAALDALAGYQVFGLGALAGLFLLAIVMTIVMGGAPADEGAAMVMPPPPMPLPPARREEAISKPPVAIQEHAAPPEASPDDFDFPASTASSVQSQPPPVQNSGVSGLFDPEPEPTSDPFANSAPPPPPPPAPAPPPSFQRSAPPPPPVATSEAPAFQPRGGLMDEDEGQRTVAYPAFKPPPGQASAPPPPSADPFAMAAAQQGYDAPSAQSHEDNPDATRVAAVPAELIKAARAGQSGNTGERPALKAPTGAMPRVASIAPAAAANDEEKHFQEVFRDFVSTREKCREPADGLTFDKFKAKLLKNKEQLVAKYQCRTVRFQVYVKDGKAALKATPVKD